MRRQTTPSWAPRQRCRCQIWPTPFTAPCTEATPLQTGKGPPPPCTICPAWRPPRRPLGCSCSALARPLRRLSRCVAHLAHAEALMKRDSGRRTRVGVHVNGLSDSCSRICFDLQRPCLLAKRSIPFAGHRRGARHVWPNCIGWLAIGSSTLYCNCTKGVTRDCVGAAAGAAA